MMNEELHATEAERIPLLRFRAFRVFHNTQCSTL